MTKNTCTQFFKQLSKEDLSLDSQGRVIMKNNKLMNSIDGDFPNDDPGNNYCGIGCSGNQPELDEYTSVSPTI